MTLLSELDFLLERVRAAGGPEDPSMRHLASPMAVRDYIRMADNVARTMRGRRVLDWGCGYGQLSYLLAERGVEVAAYDVGAVIEDGRLGLVRPGTAVRGRHPYELPFRSGAFDAVLACGVLEHVADIAGSLEEIRRVVAPGGRLFVCNLPQRFSYKEFLIAHLRLGYSHERRFTGRAIRAMLERHGFRVVRVRRAGLLPHLATGLPPRARRLYYRAAPSLFATDRALSNVPLLNRVAQSLEVEAYR